MKYMAHTFHNKESIIDLFIKQLHNRKDKPIVIRNNYYKTYNDIYCQLLKIASYIKVNISGVMPPIFASALLGFPTTIAQFIPESSPAKSYFSNITLKSKANNGNEFVPNIFFIS